MKCELASRERECVEEWEIQDHPESGLGGGNIYTTHGVKHFGTSTLVPIAKCVPLAESHASQNFIRVAGLHQRSANLPLLPCYS